MDTTNHIKSLTKVYIALAIASAFEIRFISGLHPLLEEYNAQRTNTISSYDDFMLLFGSLFGVIAILYLTAHVLSVVGLLLEKSWAKPTFIYTVAGGVLFASFVEPGPIRGSLTTAIETFSILVCGSIAGLLIYTPSVFNQKLTPDL